MGGKKKSAAQIGSSGAGGRATEIDLSDAAGPRPVPGGATGPPDSSVGGRLLWSAGEVVGALGVSRRTLDREVASGRFPRPDVRIGRMLRWRPETVRRWVDGL